MGYRSDVYLAVKKEEVEMIEHSRPVIGKFLAEADKIDVRDDKVYYEFHNVKWYANIYPEIILLMEWLQELDDVYSYDQPYQFARIGEDYEDIESLGSWEFGKMHINRSVSY
jgi:hypothetical protein